MKGVRFWHMRLAWSCLAVLLIGLPFLGTSPGYCGAPSEISFMHTGHFVPAFEQEIRKQMEVWGKQKGVAVRADFVSGTEFDAKLVSEAETRTGHDVVAIRLYDAALYQDSLADQDALATELGAQHGGWLPIAQESSYFGGHWKAVPFYHQSEPAVYRTDLFQQIGLTREQVHALTWDRFLDAAKKLHALGKPVAFAISQTPDSECALYPLLWAFGSSTVDKAGKVVINSPQTAKAIEYVKELAKYMPREVLGWDDASNNRFMLAGEGSYTFNPPSIWVLAERDVPALKGKLDHAPMPAGPAGRFRNTLSFYLATWKFKASPLANDLIRFLMSPENYRAQVEASGGFNQPLLKGYQALPIWRTNLPLNAYEPVPERLALQGWPGPPEKAAAAQKAWVTHLVPVMFAKAVTGTPTAEAMRWAEEELKQLYR